MKVLLLGSNGQLAKKLLETAPTGFEVLPFSRESLDLQSFDSLKKVFDSKRFDIVINGAAYTQVDKAETDKAQAFAINSEAVATLAELCRLNNAFLVHFSTDYVFSGTSSLPYTEDYTIAPVGIYGKSKADGEAAIKKTGCRYAIIRTSWLYAEYGKNFFRTIAGRLLQNSPVKVVADQIGTPTYVGDLAKLTWTILSNPENLQLQEVYHFSNEGTASWYDFAFEIGALLGKEDLVSPIKTTEYPTPAKRPQYSVLDKSKVKDKFKLSIPHWKLSLRECFNEYKKLENL